MKKTFKFFTAVSLLILLALFYGCKKKPDLPTVTTTAISSITTTTAASGGNVTADGGAEVTARGVCWGTATKPLVTGSKTSDGKGTGSFTSSITSLTPSTTYYVRAYATNSEGTAYGNELSFPSAAIVGATVTTTKPTGANVTATSAIGGGNVTADGGAPVTERGLCWATTANPTTTGTKIASGSGTGTFTATMTPLLPGTLYHVRAYAINSFGPSYGTDETFTTTAVAPTVTTAAITVYAQTTATAGGDVTATGGADVTARGVCYGTTANPLITGPHVAAAAGGPGAFTCNLTGLTPGTLYYVRAYATNSINTSYGNQVTVTTRAISVATLTTTTPNPVTNVSAVTGGNITADGGGAITERGVCWGTSAAPTTGGSHQAAATAGTGSFTVTITGLSEGTLYHIRAYAINSAGPAYGNEVTILTSISDADGNIYKTVMIGTQIWMAENLKTTKYRDGITNVPLVTDNTSWAGLSTPAYCWYANDEANKAVYGALYNWFAVNTGNLCPTGWSVPSDDDWTALTTFLGGESVAGGKLKEAGTTHWLTPNTGATNESGFTALPGGYRYRLNGTFADIGILSYWWSSTEYTFDPTIKAYYREMFNDQASVFREGAYKTAGKYVRCLKD